MRFPLRWTRCATRRSSAASVIKPHDNAASLRINSRVLGARDAISAAAGRNDKNGLEGRGTQQFPDFSDDVEQTSEPANRREAGTRGEQTRDQGISIPKGPGGDAPENRQAKTPAATALEQISIRSANSRKSIQPRQKRREH